MCFAMDIHIEDMQGDVGEGWYKRMRAEEEAIVAGHRCKLQSRIRMTHHIPHSVFSATFMLVWRVNRIRLISLFAMRLPRHESGDRSPQQALSGGERCAVPSRLPARVEGSSVSNHLHSRKFSKSKILPLQRHKTHKTDGSQEQRLSKTSKNEKHMPAQKHILVKFL